MYNKFSKTLERKCTYLYRCGYFKCVAILFHNIIVYVYLFDIYLIFCIHRMTRTSINESPFAVKTGQKLKNQRTGSYGSWKRGSSISPSISNPMGGTFQGENREISIGETITYRRLEGSLTNK